MAPEPPHPPGIESEAGEAASLDPGTASTELVALVATEIRRIAYTKGRDRGAAQDAERLLANLLARVLSECALSPQDRPPFLTIYARAVRHIVCDHLARYGTGDLDSDVLEGAPTPDAVLSLDAILIPLERVNPRLVNVVDCLYFARLTEEETAASFDSDKAVVQREWTRARAWVLKELAVHDAAAPRSEVSVANAVWVDAVLRSAIALPVHDRDAFLGECRAAAPGLRQDVEELLGLSDPEVPGPAIGDISAEFLWSVLQAAGAVSPPVVHAPATPEEPEALKASAHVLPQLPASAEPMPQPEEPPPPVGERGVTGSEPPDPADRRSRFIPSGRVPLAIVAAVALLGAALIPSQLARWRQNTADAHRSAAIDRVLAGIFDDPGDRPVTPDARGARTYVDRAAALVRTGVGSDSGRRSVLLLTIGRAYFELGAWQSSIEVLDEAVGLARQQHGADSVAVADILEPLAQAYHALGRYGESESSLRTARAIRVLRAGAAPPDTRSVDVALAAMLHRLGRTAEAEEILRSQLGAARASEDAGAVPDQLATRSGVALAGVLRDRGLSGEAERLYRDALGANQQHGSADRANAQVGLAALLIARGDTEEPTTLLLDGIQALRQRHGPDHPALLDALRTQGRLRLAQSRFLEALAALAEAQRIHQRSVAAFTIDVPATRGLQAELALKEGRMADAVAASRLALDEFERLSLGGHPLTIDLRAVLGEALTALGRRDEAATVLGRAVTAAQGALPAADARLVRLRSAIADATGSRGRR